jgi:tetratricopeptide (TPR) repeat protein
MKRRDRQRRSGQAASSASTEGQTSRPSGKRAGFIDSVRRWIVPRADRSAVRSLWLWCLSGLLATGLVVAALVVGVAAFRSPVVVPGADLQFDDPAVSAAHEAACDQVRQHPRSAAAWAHLGLLLAAHDHSQPATTCLAQATILEPAAWQWPYFQALVESESDLRRAVTTVAEAVNRNPQDDWPRIRQAAWLLILGRHAEAEAVYRSILADHPDHAVACLGLARVLSHGKQVSAAIAQLPHALSHPATRQAAHALLAQFRARQGDTAAAEATMAAARDLPADTPWPDDPWPQAIDLVKLGKHDMLDRIAACEANGDDDHGQQLTRTLIAFHPEFALLLQGRRQLAEGRAVEAEMAFRSGLAREPDSIELASGLGRSLAAQGRIPEATAVFRGILALEPAYAPAWTDLADCLRETDPDTAQQAAANAARYGRSRRPATISP